jgi:hypothetical protein
MHFKCKFAGIKSARWIFCGIGRRGAGHFCGKDDGFVKSPPAALRCNFVVAAPKGSHSSVFARLASGAFYKTIVLCTFFEMIKDECGHSVKASKKSLDTNTKSSFSNLKKIEELNKTARSSYRPWRPGFSFLLSTQLLSTASFL